MMRLRTFFLATLISCFAITIFAQQHATHWGYSGAVGPENWGTLDPKFSLCSSGKNQSPVNLSGLVQAELPALKFDYRPGGHEVIVNNGHTIQVNYQPGSSFSVDGRSFELKQFHFHAPSENLVDGKSFPLEAHFVHADSHGNLAVIAVFFEEDGANSELENAFAKMPSQADQESPLNPPVSAAALLPANSNYYRYNGSLTTPPCSEGVAWFVMKQTVTASKEQVEKFAHTMHHSNNRPVQPVNARVLLK
jgi:carbonic anhydrase